MIIATLYKKNTKGKQQIWTIEVEGSKYRTTEGFEGGSITPTQWTQCEATYIGKRNENSPEQQAFIEANNRVTKMFNKGWSYDINANIPIVISPMLAHKYNDHKDYVNSKEGVASQPKLDGIRCVGTPIDLFTRNGKLIVAAPHILEEVAILLKELPYVMTDGELYNHELKADFNTITSIVRKQKVTKSDLEKSEQLLQYHIYDLIADGGFNSRFTSLKRIFEEHDFKYLRLVDTTFTPIRLLDNYYAEYLEKGYEGQMIRIAGSKYQNNRTKDLLKRKEFIDDEFEIIDIEEGVGNRSGMMGRVKFKMPNGKIFDSNARGTHDYFRELLTNKQKYIGKMATVRYQNLTPGEQVPRFPVMISIRDYE